MKKKLAIILALVMVFAMLAACGGGGGPSGNGDAANPDSEGSGDVGSNDAGSDDAGSNVSSDGDVYVLKLHQHDPEDSAVGRFLNDWAAAVEEASGGRIDVQVYHGATMGGPRDTLDLIEDGTADIGWGLQSFFDGVFPKSEVFMLPLWNMDTNQMGSWVMWHLYNDYDYLKDEYSNYKVILLHCNNQSPIASKNYANDTVASIAGQNIRGNAGPPISFINELGASPISIAIGDVYESVNNNTVDTVITDWHAIYSFKLYELFKYYVDENIGFSNYFMLMNWDSYNNLPEDLQAVIDEYSGDKALELCGTYWDDIEAEVRNIIATDYPEAQFIKLSDAERANLETTAQTVIDDWIASHEDGQALYDAMEELIASYPG